MAATLKVIVAGFATFVEEFLEEESVQEEEDVLEEFLPLFYATNLFSERRKAVRIEGYAETVVPNYNLSEFRSHLPSHWSARGEIFRPLSTLSACIIAAITSQTCFFL